MHYMINALYDSFKELYLKKIVNLEISSEIINNHKLCRINNSQQPDFKCSDKNNWQSW